MVEIGHDLVEVPEHRASHSLFKSVTERLLALGALMALLPLLVIVAVLVKLDSRGPVMFRQARHGLGGRTFHIYKFRTMSAVASKEAFVQASLNDVRVTRLGRFLRASSIDELPQLINVLTGDMALVGPRPHPLALDEQYRGEVARYMDRYQVRPGITGLAQVSGHRGPTPTVEAMAARVRYDLDYIETWSPRLDASIVLRTVVMLFLVRNGS